MEEVKKFNLNSIYFYLTEGCNLACRHCWIAPKYQTGDISYPYLDVNLFRFILRQAKHLGLSAVKLTGGEPLLHPRILDIINIVRKEELRLTMETNGILCTPEIARAISNCKNPFVSVSLDAADPEIHEWIRGVNGSFKSALNGIRNLVEAGLKPQIIMTIMRKNKDQIEPIVRLSESLGAGSVKFNILQPTARGEKLHQSGDSLTIEELVELGRWVENTLSASTNMRIVYSHPPAFRPLGKMFGSNGIGCDICGIFNILGVLADGSYALCGIGETVPELVFGHASKDSLKEVWEGAQVLLRIREGLPEGLQGVCSRCVMKYMCLGSCIAQNYYQYRSLWAPFWYCEQAKEAGLFPETRLQPSKEIVMTS